MNNISISFVKMVGSGNDFVVIDNRDEKITNRSIVAQTVCHHTQGIGADGLLLVEKSQKADFFMRIINADGSEAEMCGNGSRCIAQYAYDNAIARNEMTFETLAGIIHATIFEHSVKVRMIDPHDIQKHTISLPDNQDISLSFINTGVPHAVMLVHDANAVDVKRIGNAIRFHSAFAPRGTNVDFVQIIDEHTIQVRTYERGVEDETLSCGSGSTASALIACIEKNLVPPITVHTKSGDDLIIYAKITPDKNHISDVFLEGKVHTVFTGSIILMV